jgi:hypothetical protein
MSLAVPGAGAQTVYRCGTSYSQSPCPAGVAIAVDDPRTAQQKQETEAAVRRDAKTADSMEKSRLKQEAMDRPAQLAAARAAQKALAQKPEKPPAAKKQAKKKEKDPEPEVFTQGKKKEVAGKGTRRGKSTRKKDA